MVRGERDPPGTALLRSTLRAGGTSPRSGEPIVVDTHHRLADRVDQEQDDVLCTLQLVQGDDDLSRRLFDQLVDLLVESMFLDLRQRYLAGAIERDEYVDELAALAEQCRGAGLLPLPSREG
jgi:hypothetical protein